jgi:serine/threonine protein kinase
MVVINNKDIIERKLKAIAANVTKCNMDQVSLKLQINSNNKLGGGVYGTAYKAYASNGKMVPFVVKKMQRRRRDEQESQIEHDTIRVLRNNIPPFARERIPRVYGYKICATNEYLFSNLIKGVTLRNFIPNSEIQMASIITQVLYTLYIINDKIPSFRHHDLHQDNILIVKVKEENLTIKISGKEYLFNNGGVKAVIIDFGMATVTGVNNPKINQGELSYAGISRTSKSIYDAHFFLNSVYLSAPRT